MVVVTYGEEKQIDIQLNYTTNDALILQQYMRYKMYRMLLLYTFA